jgi:translation initiation factor IF-3
MARAREAGLDLVEVDSNGKPPVCRILDYGKFKYEQSKRERDARKHQRGTMIHEVRLRPRTGQHDIDLKVRIATRLLATGDKVKLSVMFRGREISHPEVGREVLNKAIAGLGDTVTIEKPPGMEGRFLTVILSPAKKPAAKDGSKARPGNGAAGGGKKAAKAEKAVEAKAAPAKDDKKTPAKPAPATEAKVETKAAPAEDDKKAPAKADEALEAKVETKAAPAEDGDASAAKKAEAAATTKKDEA